MSPKEFLFAHCQNYVNQRLARIHDEINSIQKSANEETKSSAGDKYETGRAMAQLEVERNIAQLRETEKIQNVLQNIIPQSVTDVAIPGALVTTTQSVFYIAISLGAVTCAQQEYFIISADSPIGKQLIGKRVGESYSWKAKTYTIQAIE